MAWFNRDMGHDRAVAPENVHTEDQQQHTFSWRLSWRMAAVQQTLNKSRQILLSGGQ